LQVFREPVTALSTDSKSIKEASSSSRLKETSDFPNPTYLYILVKNTVNPVLPCAKLFEPQKVLLAIHSFFHRLARSRCMLIDWAIKFLYSVPTDALIGQLSAAVKLLVNRPDNSVHLLKLNSTHCVTS
jgi:hypothetical protein